MSTTSIIIIAAGIGSRMQSDLPKVLHQIAQRPALAYVLETALSIHPDQIILVTAPSMENVRQFADGVTDKITHAIQEKALGTGDAVKSALSYLDNQGKTIILYGDAPFVTMDTVAKIHRSTQEFLLVGFHTNRPNKYGRLITYDNDLLEIIEFEDASQEQRLINHCNSGILAIKNQHLKTLIPLIKNRNVKREFYLTDLIKIAFQNDIPCSVMDVHEEEVLGINNREELSIAEEVMQSRIKNRLMNQGVTFINPRSSYVAYDFEAGRDVVIYPNVFIGRNVKIGDNISIYSFSHIEGATIEDNVSIGPFARIRPTTHIAHSAKIGNFVEIKNSQIDYSAKISHLSYIGDSRVGYETNIGAGSITCNFDGIHTKARTEIGNQVAVGSNVCLVAPVVIADRAFIAAGSVVTEDVGEDDLVFARAKQVNLAKKAKALRNKDDQ